MTLSNKDRQKKWRVRQTKLGKKPICVNLDRKSHTLLSKIKDETGNSFSEIMNHAVTSYAGNKQPLKNHPPTAKITSINFKPNFDEVFAQKRKDGKQRLIQIMDIALVLFAEKGYHSTSIEDIIQEVGIARRTFYTHFRSKEDLLSKIIMRYLGFLSDSIDYFLKEVSGKATESEVTIITIDSIRQVSKIPEVRLFWKLLLGEIIGLKGIFWEQIEEFVDKIKWLTINAIIRLQKSDIINQKKVDPLVTTLCLIGSLKEISYNALVREEQMDLEKTIKNLVYVLSHSLFSSEGVI